MTKHRIQLLPPLLVAVVAITFSLVGCYSIKIGSIFPTSGEPPVQIRVTESFRSGGEVRITLPDGVVLTGERTEISSATDLDAVLVATPNGVITATNLAGFERPNVVATLTGQGIKMICVYIGDSQSDYEVTCADSNAGRWVDRRATQRGHPGALR